MGPHHAIAEEYLNAAVDPSRWLRALAQTAAATGSDHAQIIGIGTGHDLTFNWVSDIDDAVLRPFDAIDTGSPLINYRVAASVAAAPGTVLHETHYADARATLMNDAYLDLVAAADIPHGCQADLRRDACGLLGFALLRSSRTGPTTPEVRADFAVLARHAAAAAALQVALEQDGHRLIAGSFAAMGTATFVLDRALRVGASTAAAESLLREGVVRLTDGRVALPSAIHDRRLAAAMAAVAAGHAPAGHVVVPDGRGGQVMTLKLHRLPARAWDMAFSPAAILVVKRSRQAGLIDAGVLRDTYHLTATETEIALLLLAGHPREVICAVRGITRETLRTHLRALFAKLEVNREVEAIHLLHAVLG